MTLGLHRVRVWDLPTRVFHLALIVSVVGAWSCAQLGGNAMVWHFRFGYAVCALLLFRLVWGLVGGRWSRFVHWAFRPGAVLRYWQGRPAPGERFDVGHSPLGVLSVLTLLGLVALQVSTGLFADDDIANVGPLNRFISAQQAAWLTAVHQKTGQWLLPGWIGMHVAAAFYYQWIKRRRIISAMISGDQWAAADTPASDDGRQQRGLALLIALAAGALVAWCVTLL